MSKKTASFTYFFMVTIGSWKESHKIWRNLKDYNQISRENWSRNSIAFWAGQARNFIILSDWAGHTIIQRVKHADYYSMEITVYVWLVTIYASLIKRAFLFPKYHSKFIVHFNREQQATIKENTICRPNIY